jgi:hypothetical protein
VLRSWAWKARSLRLPCRAIHRSAVAVGHPPSAPRPASHVPPPAQATLRGQARGLAFQQRSHLVGLLHLVGADDVHGKATMRAMLGQARPRSARPAPPAPKTVSVDRHTVGPQIGIGASLKDAGETVPFREDPSAERDPIRVLVHSNEGMRTLVATARSRLITADCQRRSDRLADLASVSHPSIRLRRAGLAVIRTGTRARSARARPGRCIARQRVFEGAHRDGDPGRRGALRSRPDAPPRRARSGQQRSHARLPTTPGISCDTIRGRFAGCRRRPTPSCRRHPRPHRAT